MELNTEEGLVEVKKKMMMTRLRKMQFGWVVEEKQYEFVGIVDEDGAVGTR